MCDEDNENDDMCDVCGEDGLKESCPKCGYILCEGCLEEGCPDCKRQST